MKAPENILKIKAYDVQNQLLVCVFKESLGILSIQARLGCWSINTNYQANKNFESLTKLEK